MLIAPQIKIEQATQRENLLVAGSSKPSIKRKNGRRLLGRSLGHNRRSRP